MKRRTLDIVLSSGGVVLAGLLVVLGLVLASNANFARDYVADQLGEQQISFKPAEALTPEEAESECLVEFAGQTLTTGKQAECYANEFIGLHLSQTENAEGMTYASIGTRQRELTQQVADAQAAGDQAAAAAAQQELDAVSAARETLFKGETLRGLLLTTYGFSIFGEKAGLAATVMFIVAAILGLIAIAGFVHAFVTPKDEAVRLAGVLGGESEADTPKAAPRVKRPQGRAKKKPNKRGPR